MRCFDFAAVYAVMTYRYFIFNGQIRQCQSLIYIPFQAYGGLKLCIAPMKPLENGGQRSQCYFSLNCDFRREVAHVLSSSEIGSNL